ncbi:MAG: glycosyltransferase, partial [Pseudomonadota bacterium]
CRVIVHASTQSELGILETDISGRCWLNRIGPMKKLGPFEWQVGALSIPVSSDDIVVVCGAPRTLSTLALMVKTRAKGAKLVWWGHYWSSTSKEWRARIRLWMLRFTDAVIFYTDAEVERYKKYRKVGKIRPVHALNNGLNVSEISKFRAPYMPGLRPRDLFFLGRISEKSGLRLALEALSLPECQHITLDIVGDGPLKKELQQYSLSIGVNRRVNWHEATVAEGLIAEIANACKAFVYPGSVGLSLIHTLTYGLPAIVHSEMSAQMPEFAALQPGKNGITFSRGDATSLANAINSLVSDDTYLTELSRGAILTTEHTYNTEDMAKRFSKTIAELFEMQ